MLKAHIFVSLTFKTILKCHAHGIRSICTEHTYLHDMRIWCGSTHLNKQSCSAEVALDGAGFFHCERCGGFTLYANCWVVVAVVKSSLMKSYSSHVRRRRLSTVVIHVEMTAGATQRLISSKAKSQSEWSSPH